MSALIVDLVGMGEVVVGTQKQLLWVVLAPTFIIGKKTGIHA